MKRHVVAGLGPAVVGFALALATGVTACGGKYVRPVTDEKIQATPERLVRGARAGCIAGAPSFAEYRGGLARAGFTGITITPAQQAGDGVHSAIIRAAKP